MVLVRNVLQRMHKWIGRTFDSELLRLQTKTGIKRLNPECSGGKMEMCANGRSRDEQYSADH